MKMTLFLMILSVLSTSTAALAFPAGGPSTGGGGFVVACPATPIGPARTELLDIYEARANPQFVLAASSGRVADDYFASVQRTYAFQGEPGLAGGRRAEILENLNKFFLSMKFVEAAQLPVANDLGATPWIPSGCSLQQIAFFDDASETVYVRQDLFAKLGSLDQAALVQHELWYRNLRGLKDRTSQLTRLAVGHLFALRGVVPVMDGIVAQSRRYWASNLDEIPSVDGSRGTTEVSDFYVTPMMSVSGGILRLQFTAIQGRSQLTKTWVDIPGGAWDLKRGPSSSNPQLSGCIVQTPNQDMELETPIQGSMTTGLSLRLSYRTGEPVTLTLVRAGEVLSVGKVDICDE